MVSDFYPRARSFACDTTFCLGTSRLLSPHDLRPHPGPAHHFTCIPEHRRRLQGHGHPRGHPAHLGATLRLARASAHRIGTQKIRRDDHPSPAADPSRPRERPQTPRRRLAPDGAPASDARATATGVHAPPERRRAPPRRPPCSRRSCASGLRPTLTLDRPKMMQNLERSWFRLDAVSFLQDLVTPFLAEVGMAWYRRRDGRAP